MTPTLARSLARAPQCVVAPRRGSGSSARRQQRPLPRASQGSPPEQQQQQDEVQQPAQAQQQQEEVQQQQRESQPQQRPRQREQEPPEPAGGGGPNLPPQLRRFLALLTEFGGTYGTAAVAIAWLTHVDPFGNLHWQPEHVAAGLAAFVPLLAFDAGLMLPDWSRIDDPDERRAVAGLFLGSPAVLGARDPAGGDAAAGGSEAAGAAAAAEAVEADEPGVLLRPAAAAGQLEQEPAQAAPPPLRPVSPLLRLRVTLGLLQTHYTKNNPGAALSPLAESAVVCVATLADEMLYRAVGLTLLGLWIRDRMYEAGADDTIGLTWLSSRQLPTAEAARYAAVAVIAGLGVAGFALGALREVRALQNMRVLDREGKQSAAAASLKAQLISSLGSQNILLYLTEGLREVSASIAAGLCFITTGNLAAPLAGSVALQLLFSAYQRVAAERSRRRRKDMLRTMKQRNDKLQAAMSAALALRQAEVEAKTAGDADPAAAAAGEGEAAGGADPAVAAPAAPAAAAPAAAAAAAEQLQQQQLSPQPLSPPPSPPQQQQQQQQQEAHRDEPEFDFLTAVLEAAAQQEQQQKHQHQQEQQQQQEQRQQHSASSDASTAADWGSGLAAGAGSRAGAPGGQSGGIGGQPQQPQQLPSPEAARQKLEALLLDMLRSPEGQKVVAAWLARQPGAARGGSQREVDELLADPATKAQLLAALEAQLLASAAALDEAAGGGTSSK